MVSNNDKLVLCDVIKGTKSIINPMINNRNKINVVTTANVFLNFSLLLKNSTIGLAIIENIKEITKYINTVWIKKTKYNPTQIKVITPSALKIPLAIVLDGSIHFFFKSKSIKKISFNWLNEILKFNLIFFMVVQKKL